MSGADAPWPEALVIAPIAASDEREWRALWQGYLAFYETRLDAPMIALAFERLLSDDPAEPRGFIARDGETGAALGLVHFLYHRHGWREAPVCYLQDLFVAPEGRRGGVGEQLMRAVFAAADQDGAADVYWLTQDFNETARRLYDRIGKATPFIKYTRG